LHKDADLIIFRGIAVCEAVAVNGLEGHARGFPLLFQVLPVIIGIIIIVTISLFAFKAAALLQ
jgi:hypothetical protein